MRSCNLCGARLVGGTSSRAGDLAGISGSGVYQLNDVSCVRCFSQLLVAALVLTISTNDGEFDITLLLYSGSGVA